jgi:hypothetical protein
VKDLHDLLDEIRRISVAELVPLLSEGLVLVQQVRDEYQGARTGATGQKVEGQRTVIHGGGMHNHDCCLESTETRENVEIFQKITWLTLDKTRAARRTVTVYGRKITAGYGTFPTIYGTGDWVSLVKSP